MPDAYSIWLVVTGGLAGIFAWAVTSLRYEWPRRIFVAPPPAHKSEVDENRLVELLPAIQAQWDLLDEIVAWRKVRDRFDESRWWPAWVS